MVIATTLIVFVFETYVVQKSQFAIPILSNYNIYYGETPTEVSRKLEVSANSKEKLQYANETVYNYDTVILGRPSKLVCYFLYGKYLFEADVYISSEDATQTRELFSQAREQIEKEYANNDNFTCGKVTGIENGLLRQTFDVNNGATGIDYTIEIQESCLSISCRKIF